ncbi:MAG: amidohydrolase family protein [Streptosporangiales bacterium]|nr:amidohydrolase family protein [Streptosporangiales bacterium]
MTSAEPSASVQTRTRGYVLRGRLWPGGDEPAVDDAVVVVDVDGVVAAYGPAHLVDLPEGAPVVEGGWVGPGVVDAHVHLAFGSVEGMVRGGVVGMRDLGAPLEDATSWRVGGAVGGVAVAGPILTAPGGYPSRSWGARGFARFLGSPAEARRAVESLAAAGVDVVKVALEPADGLPVPPLDVVSAVVAAAHDEGLGVVCHALTAELVARALDAGVDELAHMPVERLPTHLVAQLALAGTPVVGTLHTLTAAGGDQELGVLANARALVGAGVPVLYGTDLGNEATSTGVDPVELTLLAEAGLGAEGALRAAVEGAATVHGLRGRYPTTIRVGQPAQAVVLGADPLAQPQAWASPVAWVVGTEVARP